MSPTIAAMLAFLFAATPAPGVQPSVGQAFQPAAVAQPSVGQAFQPAAVAVPAVPGAAGVSPAAVAVPAVAVPSRPWQFSAHLDGGDVIADGYATHFNDPVTRTGVNAATSVGCSIPRGLCAATAGSPFSTYSIPDYTLVRIYCPASGRTTIAPIIDEGPGRTATAGTGRTGSAMIDLTPSTAGEMGITIGQNRLVRIRILAASAPRGRDVCRRR